LVVFSCFAYLFSFFVLALVMLGHEHVKLYDASLSEWASDPSLPMETG